MSRRDSYYVCDQCGKSVSQTSGGYTPSGWVTYSGEGFINKLVPKHFCCEGHKLLYLNLQSDNNARSTSTQTNESYSAPAKEVDYEAIALANAEKAKAELEKQKHEDEMALKRRQQELEEKKERQKRADELRAQGKNFQATIVEYNLMTVFGVIALFAIMGGFIFYMNHSSKTVAKDASEINLKLEGIEDQIKLAIQDGNRDKALELTNQLVHPMHEKWEEKFGFVSGDVYYDDWWSKRRQEYKDQIMAMPNTNSSRVSEPSKDEMSSEESDAPSQATEEKAIEENTSSSSDVTPIVTLYKVNDPDGYSNLRTTPNGSIIRKVLNTETFEVIGTDGKFKKVRLSDGVEGFIHESRVISIN